MKQGGSRKTQAQLTEEEEAACGKARKKERKKENGRIRKDWCTIYLFFKYKGGIFYFSH